MTLHWFTQLDAEDGSYLKRHESKDAAWTYVQDQMGDQPEKNFLGRFYDDYGRSMVMFETTQDEADDLSGDWS